MVKTKQYFEPEVVAFLEDFYLTQDQLHEMMNIIRESDESALKLAKDWLDTNPDVVDSWLQ